MSARRRSAEGSRYLYDSFDVASRAEVAAQERVTDVRFAAFEAHFQRLEAAVDRMERRLWAALAGVATIVATEVVRAVMSWPGGGG